MSPRTWRVCAIDSRALALSYGKDLGLQYPADPPRQGSDLRREVSLCGRHEGQLCLPVALAEAIDLVRIRLEILLVNCVVM